MTNITPCEDINKGSQALIWVKKIKPRQHKKTIQSLKVIYKTFALVH